MKYISPQHDEPAKKKIKRAYLSRIDGNLNVLPFGGPILEGTLNIDMAGITEDNKYVRFPAIFPHENRKKLLSLIREIEQLIEGSEQHVTEIK